MPHPSSPFAARLNHSEMLINYASRHNPRPKRLLRRLNYSFERFDVLENCRDTRDGRCFIIQESNVVGAAGAGSSLQDAAAHGLVFNLFKYSN